MDTSGRIRMKGTLLPVSVTGAPISTYQRPLARPACKFGSPSHAAIFFITGNPPPTGHETWRLAIIDQAGSNPDASQLRRLREVTSSTGTSLDKFHVRAGDRRRLRFRGIVAAESTAVLRSRRRFELLGGTRFGWCETATIAPTRHDEKPGQSKNRWLSGVPQLPGMNYSRGSVAQSRAANRGIPRRAPAETWSPTSREGWTRAQADAWPVCLANPA